ncbi:hypothetical protein C450_06812, partial [Halococcus salifodinae DSM 8989]
MTACGSRIQTRASSRFEIEGKERRSAQYTENFQNFIFKPSADLWLGRSADYQGERVGMMHFGGGLVYSTGVYLGGHSRPVPAGVAGTLA